jgi:acetyl-CoA carboxylase carboxyltransferase component
MHPLPTRVNCHSDAFKKNRAQNLAAVEVLRGHLRKAHDGGGEKYVSRHLERGKLLPRQRIDLFLDRDSPFLELAALAGLHEPGKIPGGSVVTGIGTVNGVECMISASESTIQGGAIGPIGVRKAGRIAEIAWENRLPAVHMIESAGADLPNQAEIFVPGGGGFRNITMRSEQRIPTVSLVFGSCTAGGAYVPGMSDYVVMVDKAAYMYLAGPPLVKMATGEVVDDEALGGAEMHCRVSGVSDYLARDERDCLRIGREIVGRLNWRKQGPRPTGAGDPPLYDPEELLGIASADLRTPFDMREVIGRLVDSSRFAEFKPLYGPTLVCGYAELCGYKVGILANNGILFSESANKGAQFIMLCNQTDTPLLFLQNITGFMVGRAAEEAGIIRAGAKMINAVSNSTVPAITLMVGGSYGAGNYAMAGRAYHPRFVFTWPNHRIAVMGPEQLAGVLDIVKREAAAKKGEAINEEQLALMKQMLVGKVEHDSTCWAATGRVYDDGVIDPRQTRIVLAMALSAIHNAPVRGTTSWGTFRH